MLCLFVTKNTTLTPILFTRRYSFNSRNRVVVICDLHLEPDSDGGRIIESVGVGRQRTLQS